MSSDFDNDEALDYQEPQAQEQPEPEYTGTDLHPSQVKDYEPHFDRLSVTRRVLGHVTDEVDVDSVGPRNTLEAISHGLVTDDNTPIHGSATDAASTVQGHLEKLQAAGLVAERDDGSYEVTDEGLTELRN